MFDRNQSITQWQQDLAEDDTIGLEQIAELDDEDSEEEDEDEKVKA